MRGLHQADEFVPGCVPSLEKQLIRVQRAFELHLTYQTSRMPVDCLQTPQFGDAKKRRQNRLHPSFETCARVDVQPQGLLAEAA